MKTGLTCGTIAYTLSKLFLVVDGTTTINGAYGLIMRTKNLHLSIDIKQ